MYKWNGLLNMLTIYTEQLQTLQFTFLINIQKPITEIFHFFKKNYLFLIISQFAFYDIHCTSIVQSVQK